MLHGFATFGDHAVQKFRTGRNVIDKADPAKADPAKAAGAAPAAGDAEAATAADSPKIVSLDSFRKK